jgi:hypothetical protein
MFIEFCHQCKVFEIYFFFLGRNNGCHKNGSNFYNKYHVKVRFIVLRCSALSSLKGVQCIVVILKYDPCKIYKLPAELLNLLGYVAVSTGIFDFRKTLHHYTIQIN